MLFLSCAFLYFLDLLLQEIQTKVFFVKSRIYTLPLKKHVKEEEVKDLKHLVQVLECCVSISLALVICRVIPVEVAATFKWCK